jgi:hypothetical protein
MPDRYEVLRPFVQQAQGTAVEIGTFKGDFAEYFLRESFNSYLFCIDPYKRFDEGIYKDNINSHSQEQYDALYEQTKQRLDAVAPRRFQIKRLLSVDAATTFPDGSVNFLYIDGNHDYKHVMEDLVAWLPKLAKGAILVGDDVNDTAEHEHKRDVNGDVKIEENGVFYGYYGVKKAVTDFCATRGLTPQFLEAKQFVIRF